MKLSEAIRQGAKLHPQGFRDYIQWREPREGETPDYFGQVTCTCATAAAFEAMTGDLPRPSWIEKRVNRVLTKKCDLAYKRISHPQVGRGSVLAVVSGLNDAGKTREWIADWLEAQGY